MKTKTFTEQMFGHNPDILTRKEGTRLLPGLIGIEIEYENFGIAHSRYVGDLKWWRSHEDGSLRDGGMEINFTQALSGQDAENAINALSKMPPGLSLSERTSTHVHVDMRDLSTQELWNVISVSMVMDPYIFAAFAPNRETNTFCLPAFSAPGSVHPGLIKTKVSNETLHGFVRNWAKYSSVNAAAAQEFGSLEYRHAHATTDPEYLFRLVNTLLSIKLNGKDIDSQRLPGMLSELGSLGFIRVILGQYAEESVVTDEMQYKMLSAARLIQDLYRTPMSLSREFKITDSLVYKHFEKRVLNFNFKDRALAEAESLFKQVPRGELI